MKYLSLDIETCGLNPKTDSILEFGAILDDLENPLPYQLCPKYHCYFLPADGIQYHGQPFALSMHPKIFRMIAERENDHGNCYKYLSPNKFGYDFKQFLIKECWFEPKSDRCTINVAGKNFGAFDLQFLNEQTDLSKHVKIRHKILDPGAMYMEIYDDVVPGTEECLERAGIRGKEIAHTALEDAWDVIELIRFKMLDKETK